MARSALRNLDEREQVRDALHVNLGGCRVDKIGQKHGGKALTMLLLLHVVIGQQAPVLFPLRPPLQQADQHFQRHVVLLLFVENLVVHTLPLVVRLRRFIDGSLDQLARSRQLLVHVVGIGHVEELPRLWRRHLAGICRDRTQPPLQVLYGHRVFLIGKQQLAIEDVEVVANHERQLILAKCRLDGHPRAVVVAGEHVGIRQVLVRQRKLVVVVANPLGQGL